jgi:hypothetical protein
MPTIHQPMVLELISASSRREALAIWRTLETEISIQRLTNSSVWTETWLNHFGNQVPHQFIVARRGDSPCGITLVTQAVDQCNGPLRFQSWHLGTSGEPDADSVCVEHNTLLVRPEDRLEFHRLLWAWAVAKSDWDEFRLDGFQADEISDWIASDDNWTVVAKPARYFDLNAARESNRQTLEILGPHTRSSIRRSVRRAGDIRFEWAETVQDAESIFAELIELHQIRWNSVGMPGSYASQTFREFHYELLNRLVPLGQMGLFRVRNDRVTIGCDQVLIDQNRACIYQGGRVLPHDHRISTGVIVDYCLIEECRRRGFDAVDFLAGDSPHKRRLSTHSLPLVWASYRRPSVAHGLIDNLRCLKQFLQKSFRNPEALKPDVK